MNSPEIIIPLVTGFVMDVFIGDPRWLPHPIRLFGNLIHYGDRKLNKGKNRKIKGALLAVLLILSVFSFFHFLMKILTAFQYFYLVVASVLVFYGLANRSLIQESLQVIKVLNKNGIEAGRKQLGTIVGRDTANLNENEIRTAVLETLAENLSDGVIAPLLFYASGGIPAMFAYKMINTLDSMIGYKNEQYSDFGWFAAKIDDVLNFIPARITAFLMVVLTLSWRGCIFILKYGNKHSSPNAGYPEAALAGILNCRLGGPNLYSGKLVAKPYIGENERTVSDKDIVKACVINFVCTLLFATTMVLINIYRT